MRERYTYKETDTGSPEIYDDGDYMGIARTKAKGITICAALNAANSSTPSDSSPEGETVDVRVAVAVAPDGRWRAYGGYDRDMSSAVDALISDVDDQLEIACYILTAKLPVPKVQEVAAGIEQKDTVANEDAE